MQVPFKRALVGDQTGVVVKVPADTTGMMLPSAGAGVVAVVGQFSRGRYDKPFLVDRSKVQQALGKPKSMRANRQNEAHVQAYEAALRGASGIVVSRVVSAEAKLKWIIVQNDAEKPIVLSADEVKPAKEQNPNMIFAFRLKNAISDGVVVQVKYNKTTKRFSVVVREDSTATAAAGGSGVIIPEFV